MPNTRTTSIDDLAFVGHELTEQHLQLAAGGLTRRVNQPTYQIGLDRSKGGGASYSVAATMENGDFVDSCTDPIRM